MSYEESELLSLLTKQEIDKLFLRANSYLCQVKFLLEEKEQLQQESEQLKDNWIKLKEYIKKEGFEINTREYGSLDVIDKYEIIEKMRELEIGIGKDND